MIPASEVNKIEQQLASPPTDSVMQVQNWEESNYSPPTISVQAASGNLLPSSVPASDCATYAEGGTGSQLVYALGELGYDFGTEARRDLFTQTIPSDTSLLDYLNNHPWEAKSLIWTLNLDAKPIYAIVPSGPYASVVYDRIRSYIPDTNVARVSVPGYLAGSIKLMSGQTVPVIIPAVRGMYSCSVSALVRTVMKITTLAAGVTAEVLSNRIKEYLSRIYYDYHNLGITPQERALNFCAINAFQTSAEITGATGERRVLQDISVEKSPISSPDSDSYDVKLSFCDPENHQRSQKIYLFTIDVSDVIPVTIGQVRSWTV
ncbi:peptidase S8/S53 [Nodularia sp. NIES-3585]|nr:peptidase S8/S53 [Nodularia sp. NIES-3585]